MNTIVEMFVDSKDINIGVESAHSFGDTLFNIPLIKSISKHFNAKITVAVREQYADGFQNIPWVRDVLIIGSMWQGVQLLKERGYDRIYQITQNVKFLEYKQTHPNHSLVDTPLWVGREIGIPDFDQRPIFIPTDQEIASTICYLTDEPTIAIEAEAKSGQSWANDEDIKLIIDKFADTHRILWLSLSAPPCSQKICDLRNITRRQAIMCLRAADIFFSVGSGFFCSSIALPKRWQPRRIICLWDDSFYRYKERITELDWHEDITWVDSRNQLTTTLVKL